MEDFGVASQVLRGGGTWLQWTNEFSTSLDVFGWLGLLMVFELDTYLLSDENAERALIRWSLNAIRLICYVLLIHTVVARVTDMMEYVGVEKANGVTSLCQLAEQEFSFTENNNDWHHSVLSKKHYELAISELMTTRSNKKNGN